MEIKLIEFLSLISVCVLIHGQNITEPELLVPNYDNIEHKVKAFSIRQPLVFHCNITKEGNYQLVWERHGVEVSEVGALNGRYIIIEPENKFIIERPEETDAGHYSCRVNSTKKEFKAVANVIVRTPSNIGVSEGENLAISCVVVGTRPELYWQIGNLTIYNSTEKYILKENEDGVDNAVLRVVNVSMDDRGEYKCLARNILTDLNISPAASDITFVRVKDNLASLWPTLGICAELLVLCLTTILLKKCGKKDIDEGDE